jgi:hypothetical protein
LRPDLADLHSQLENLQEQLAARASVVNFAHAAVSMALALIIGGAAGKMFWDLDGEKEIWAFPVAALSLFLALYSTIRFVSGRKKQIEELKKFHQLEAIRRALQLDDPSKLLPP